MEEAQNYHRWILRYFRPYLGKRIFEYGAGTGNFASIVIATATATDTEFFLFEPAANLFPILQRRFAGNPRIHLCNDSARGSTGGVSPDTVLMVNVLEHVADDKECLREIFSMLPTGGHLLLFVPAVPGIYGTLDRAFEHYRRYLKEGLSNLLVDSGFRALEMRYFNFVGVAAWFYSGRILKRTAVPASDVRFYDRWIVPSVSWIEGMLEPPLGQSLLAVAEKLGR